MEESPEDVAPNDADDSSSFLESELETLQSIYINEIEVKRDDDQKCTSVSIDLHPATADKPEEQYVKMTLKFTLSEEYPHAIPGISIRNPRGLSDEKVNSTYQDLIAIAEKKIGNSMLFEIIESAKEHLTAGNRPCGECAICLYGFNESDVFIKTDCYHYFHAHCLARYAKTAETSEKKDDDLNAEVATNNELLCPMCRVAIQFSGVDEPYPPPATGDEDCQISEEILEMQKKMSDLYQKQLEKGGIIDIQAEKNKFLLEISNMPTVLNSVEKPDSVSEENDPSEKADESTCNTTQLPQSDKAQSTKEAKDPKSGAVAATRSDEKLKHNKRYNKRGNYNSHNNFPKNNRKQKTYYDSYDGDFDDEDSSSMNVKEESPDGDAETSRSPSKDATDSRNRSGAHSRFSPIGKDGQRSSNYNKPRRGNYDGYNRGNYSRYPRKNARGYNSNQRNSFDRTEQDSRRFNSGKDVSPQSDSSCTNKDGPDTPLEQTKDSQHVENPPDSYKRHSDFDKRGKNRGRYPRTGYRGWGGNYTPRRDNYNRNRREDNCESHREKDNSNNSFPNDSERDTHQDGATAEASVYQDDAQNQRSVNGRSYRYQQRRQSRGNSHKDTGAHTHDEAIRREGGDYNLDADTTDKDSSGPKNQSPENQEGSHTERKSYSRRNTGPREGNFGRNGNRPPPERLDSSDAPDDRRLNSHRGNRNQDPNSVRDRNQYHSRRNDYEENTRVPQGTENLSQNNGPRRNYFQRNSRGNSSNTDRRGYQHDYNDRRGTRGRNNPHYQNRNADFEGGQRRNHENAFQSHRNAPHYRSAPPRKFEDRHSSTSSQNGKFNESATVDQADVQTSSDVYGDVMNGSKGIDSSSVKAFVPKEDSSVSFSGDSEPVAQKAPYPPPGFSNPLKKVVYGLEAAKPPPGFPRR